MKKFIVIGLLLFGLIGLFVSFSVSDEVMESSSMEMASQEMAVTEDNAAIYEESGEIVTEDSRIAENGTSSQVLSEDGQKIIYHANLNIEVKNLDDSITIIQERTETLDGYVVESMVQGKNSEFERMGHMTVRIPQDHLHAFIQYVENESSRVIESSISGQDVTEEYVDLETRLESKQKVEKRLLNFLEEAENTEDLLLISSDLDKIQEEIEEIKGRIQYLENKIDLATVTIFLEENSVTLAGGNDLNIWDETKEQFVKSIQFIIATLSNLIVFLVGNLPVFIVIGIFGLVIYLFIRKRRNKEG